MKGLFFLLIAFVVTANQLSFPIHRMIQFQKRNIKFGSQANNGEFRFASVSSILSIEEDSRMKADHYTALVKMEELDESVLSTLVDVREVGGLVVIVPRTTEYEIVEKCNTVEKYMMKRSFNCAVYFIEEEEDVMRVYNALQSSGASISPSSMYSMTVKFPMNKKPTTLPQIRTFESVLEGFKEGVPVASNPTILITSSYDAFSISPSLSYSLEDSAVPTIATLEVLRLFKRLYASQKTVGTYNLMFLFSSGSHLDYEGYRQWMIHSSPELFESIRFVLCLDELTSSNELTLHVSRGSNNDKELARLYNTFSIIADQMNISFNMVTESVDIMKQYRVYPHERFALRRLVAGTLSASSSKDCPYLSGSVVKKPVDMVILSRNIQYVAEVLAHYMFNLNDSSLIFVKEMSVESGYVDHWMNLASRHARHSLFIQEDNGFTKRLEGELKQLVPTTSVITSEMDLKDNIQVFNDNSDSIAVFISKTPLFDLYTFLSVLVYLVIVYLAVRVMHEGVFSVKRDVQRFVNMTFGKNKKQKDN